MSAFFITGNKIVNFYNRFYGDIFKTNSLKAE
jgi:hypothetical protein